VLQSNPSVSALHSEKNHGEKNTKVTSFRLLKVYIGHESQSLRDDPSYTLMFILHAVSKPSVDYFMRVNGGRIRPLNAIWLSGNEGRKKSRNFTRFSTF
jgi:hypothetical protein